MAGNISRGSVGRGEEYAPVRGDVACLEESPERLKVCVLVIGSIERGNIVLEAAPLARFLIVAEPIRVQVCLPIDAGIFVNRAAQTVYAVVSITCVRMTLNTVHVNRCDIHRINADLLGIPIGMRIPPHLRPIIRGGGTCAHTGAKNSAEQDE